MAGNSCLPFAKLPSMGTIHNRTVYTMYQKATKQQRNDKTTSKEDVPHNNKKDKTTRVLHVY